METAGPADSVQSYLVSTEYTKEGIPKVLGLPRRNPSAASGVDEALTFPPIRPRRSNSSRPRASWPTSASTSPGDMQACVPGHGRAGRASAGARAGASGGVGYVGIEGPDGQTDPHDEPRGAAARTRTSRPYKSARASTGKGTDGTAMPPIHGKSHALPPPHPPFANGRLSRTRSAGVGSKSVPSGRGHRSPRSPRASAPVFGAHCHGTDQEKSPELRGRASICGSSGPGNQLMDGVKDSEERATVNKLTAELHRLVHLSETKAERLDELEQELEQMVLLEEENGVDAAAALVTHLHRMETAAELRVDQAELMNRQCAQTAERLKADVRKLDPALAEMRKRCKAAVAKLESLKKTSRRAAKERDACEGKARKASILAGAESSERERLIQQRRDASKHTRALLDSAVATEEAEKHANAPGAKLVTGNTMAGELAAFAGGKAAKDTLALMGQARYERVYEATGGATAQDLLEMFNSQGPKSIALNEQKEELEAELRSKRETIRSTENRLHVLELGGVEVNSHRETDDLVARVERGTRKVSANEDLLFEGEKRVGECKVGFQHLLAKLVREGQRQLPEDVYAMVEVENPNPGRAGSSRSDGTVTPAPLATETTNVANPSLHLLVTTERMMEVFTDVMAEIIGEARAEHEDPGVCEIEDPNELAIALFPPAAADILGATVRGGSGPEPVGNLNRLYNPETGMGGGGVEGTFVYDDEGNVVGISTSSATGGTLGTILDREEEVLDEDRDGSSRDERENMAPGLDNDEEQEMTRGEIKREAQKLRDAALKRRRKNDRAHKQLRK